MKIRIILLFLILSFSFIIFFAACSKRKHTITVAGSTAFQPFAEQLADKYMEQNPDIRVNIQGGGSSVGIQAALSGAADIGMADMVQLPEEAKNLTSVMVARDGIAIVENIKNKVSNLTLQQIRNIYNGKIRNWKEVGGSDHTITIVSREAGSGTRSSFESIIKDVSLTPDAIIQDSNGTLRETIVNDVNTIGYLSHGLINENVKPVSVDGILPTTEEIMKEKYLLVRPIFFLTKGEPAGIAKNFIDFILSKNGQDILKSDGLIPAK